MINLKKLQEIGLLLKKEQNESKVFDAIFNVISKSINFDFGTLFLNEAHGTHLNPVFSIDDVIVDLASDFDVGIGSGIAGWVSDNKNPVIFPNFMNNNPGRKFKSFVSIPLVIDDKLIGVLNLGHKNPEHFTQDDKENFRVLGSQVAIIIDKLNFRKELREKNIELKKALKQLQETQEKLIIKEKFASMGEGTESIKKEINNPLSVIMGFSDLLLQKCNNGSINQEILAEKLEVILDSARKINTIIHHFENSQINN